MHARMHAYTILCMQYYTIVNAVLTMSIFDCSCNYLVVDLIIHVLADAYIHVLMYLVFDLVI